MNSDKSDNSIYGIDSIPDHLDNNIINQHNEIDTLYSSGSSLHGIQSEAEASDSIEDLNNRTDKTLSVKELWSKPDLINKDENEFGYSNVNYQDTHQSIITPFIDDGNLIRYNIENGVDYNTTFVVGSKTLTPKDHNCGYQASHLAFFPEFGTLVAGRDISNGWEKISNFSLICGLGNQSELDASLISGAHNKIRLELLPKSDDFSNKDEYCLVPPSCAIIGGTHNTITNSYATYHSSAIIASSNIYVENCEETVILGMKGSPEPKIFKGYKESTFAWNLYGLGKIHAGPLNHLSNDISLEVNGNTNILGNITANNISATNINQSNKYFVGNNGPTGSNFSISPGDGTNIVYVNPISGNVKIQLGTGNNIFESNRSLIFKDVTLEFGMGSSYNIYISVPKGTRIEHYGTLGTGGMYGLVCNENGTYVLNSSGGSVTFQYISSITSEFLPTWVIQNQLTGNPRLLKSTGITFISANDDTRSRLIN